MEPSNQSTSGGLPVFSASSLESQSIVRVVPLPAIPAGRNANLALECFAKARSRVARALLDWVKRFARIPGVSMRSVAVNAGPGALLLDGQDRVIGVWAEQAARFIRKHYDNEPKMYTTNMGKTEND
jgi:hypothetical protein